MLAFDGEINTLKKNTKKFTTTALLEVLEARILFSADGLAVGAWEAFGADADSVLDNAAIASVVGTSFSNNDQFGSDGESIAVEVSLQSENSTNFVELIVIDSAVDNRQLLLDQIQVKPGVTFAVLILDQDSNGIEQIGKYLASMADVNAIHIVSHGADGVVELGNTKLTANSLGTNMAQLESWTESLADNADVLIYGCDLASSDDGRLLIDTLADILDSDVAASDDTTGHQSLAGDWVLEYETGAIESERFLSEAGVENWLSTLDVTSDLKALWTFDGSASDSAGTNDGVFHNAATYDAVGGPDLGSAANFVDDTVGNSYIEVPHTAAYNFGNSDFSIAFWYKTSASADAQEMFVSSQGDGINVANAVEIYGENTNDLVFSVSGNLVTATGSYLSDGAWHHVTAVRQGGELKLHTDGVETSSLSSVVDATTTNVYRIGASGPSGTSEFDGSMDDLRFYNRALATDDVSELTLDLNSFNDPPISEDRVVGIAEDEVYSFTAADFPFYDPEGDVLHGISLVERPLQGVLKVNGVEDTVREYPWIPAADVGNMTYTPNANYAGIDSFVFKVVDEGGEANGGVNDDQDPDTFTFTIGNTVGVGIRAIDLQVDENSANTTIVGTAESVEFSYGANVVADSNFTDHPFQINIFSAAISTAFGGWQVDSGSVEIDTGLHLPSSPQGGYVVDLNGSSPGTISQVIATVPGVEYRLNYALMGEVQGTNVFRSLSVSAGSYSEDTSFTVTAQDDMVWRSEGFNFVANSTATTITFASLTAGSFGPLLSDVEVREVSFIPEAGAPQYALTDDANGRFAIDSNSGEISVLDGTQLDFDSNEFHSVVVEVTNAVGGTSHTETVQIDVNNISEAPVLEHNITTWVAEGGAVPITPSQLTVSDADNTATELTYTVTTSPVGGFVAYTDDRSDAISTFTQQDIDDGRLMYVNTTATVNDSFEFRVEDGSVSSSTPVVGIFRFLIYGGIAPIVSSGIELNSDGGNDAYLQSSALGVSNLDASSVEVIFSASPTAANVPLVSIGDGTAIKLSISVDTVTGNLLMSVGSSATFESTVADYSALLLDQNKHSVALTWNGEDQSAILYVDGSEVDDWVNLNSGPALDLTSSTLTLGQSHSLITPANEFSGNYYDARLWDYARSAAEVSAMHNKKFLQPDSRLIANWQMDELSSQDVIVNQIGSNHLSVMHAAGAGFSYSEVRADLNVYENSSDGTSVGHVLVHESDHLRSVLADGDFSSAGVPAPLNNYISGDSLGAWSVSGGKVDLLLADGVYSDHTLLGGNTVRLNEVGAAIGQTIGTESGLLYQLTYSVGGDFSTNATPIEVATTFGSQLYNTSVDLSSVGNNDPWSLSGNMLWENRSVLVAAENSTMALQFKSDTPGVMIADVRVEEIPLEVATVLAGQINMTYDSVTSKFYKTSGHQSTSAGAKGYATSQTIDGISSRLVVIESAYENAVVSNAQSPLDDSVWIGATDAVEEGKWNWITTPTDTVQFWEGAVNGMPVNDAYTNWKKNEPNDYQPNGGEDYGILEAGGYWNDEPQATGKNYMVVEWDVSDILNSYQFESAAGSGFAINNETGEVTVDGSSDIDYESAQSITMPIDITERDGASYAESIDIAINNVNEAPESNGAISIAIEEDGVAYFPSSIFGFSDIEANNFESLIIESLPDAGALTLNGVNVFEGQEVPFAKFSMLEYRPAVDEYGASYATIEYRVKDDGGTANGGIDTSIATYTATINVTPVSDPPEGRDAEISVTVDTSYTFSEGDFSFTDKEGDNLSSIVINTVPGQGTLALSGAELVAGDIVAIADVSAGDFVFIPVVGSMDDSFTFSIQDDGSTGLNTDLSANVMAVNIRDGIVDISSGLEINADGGNNAYLISNVPLGIVADALTYEIQFAAEPSDVNSVLVSYAIDDVNQNTLMLQMVAGSNALTAYVNSGPQINIAGYDYRAALYDGNRHALAFAWESSTGQWATYIDGVKVDEGNARQGTTVDLTTGRLVLGQEQDRVGGKFQTSENFSGVIYDVRFWDKALSSEEIEEHHNHKLDPSNPPVNLIANWQMKELSSTSEVVDIVSGNNLALNHITGAGYNASVVRTDLHVYENSANETHIGYVLPDEYALAYNLLDVGISKILSENPGVVYDAETGSFYLAVYDRLAVGDAIVAANARMLNGVPGQLLSINTEHENNYIKSLMQNADTRFLTSGNDLANEGSWVWLDGTQFWQGESDGIPIGGSFTDWRIYEPNNAGASEHALELNPSGWNDIYSTIRLDYVIEWDAQIVGQYRYALADDANGRFVVDEYSGEVSVADGLQLNHELDTYHDIDVRVTSGTGNSYVKTLRIEVDNVNEAPTGIDNTISILEEASYTFNALDFDFTDLEANNLSAIVIDTLPTTGTLELDGSAAFVGMQVTTAQISDLTYTAAFNDVTGDKFDFRVIDDGGTAGTGVDTDPTANKISIDITAVNDPPTAIATEIFVNEDSAHSFNVTDFMLADVEGHTLDSIVIDTLPSQGILSLPNESVVAGQIIPASEISSLVYIPNADGNGLDFDSFGFRVVDSGGVANGGKNTSLVPASVLIHVLSVNDAPVGAKNTVLVGEESTYAFTETDFGFTDIDGNQLAAVIIESLPSNGLLSFSDGTVVGAGDSIAVAAIVNLRFTPALNANGLGYDAFTFRLQDDGGTLRNGVDTEATAHTITIDVFEVNDAPIGKNNTVVAFEDIGYRFSSADFPFNDIENHSLLSVSITGLPAVGQLSLNGTPVVPGLEISLLEISGLIYTPPVNTNGLQLASFSFQIRDGGGTLNGGIDIDPVWRAMLVDVTSVNDAPQGKDNILNVYEDTAYSFVAADFGFTDTDSNKFSSVTIDALPFNGQLQYSAAPVFAGQVININSIGLLEFIPEPDANRLAYDTFTFSVGDDGGVLNGGVDVDLISNNININVLAINDAPEGTDKLISILEDTGYQFLDTDFGFNDPDNHNLQAVSITTLPIDGQLLLSGVPVTVDQLITQSLLSGLVFVPASDAHGSSYASFTFKVQDDGGVSNADVDTDLTDNVITLDVLSVNDAPRATDKTISTLEDTPYGFNVIDFSYNDIEGHNVLNIIVTALPVKGELSLGGVPVLVGQSISANSLNSLLFIPALGANGIAYDSFEFLLQDDGGVVNGGTDTDAIKSRITIDVASVNDAPTGSDGTVTTPEDTDYLFSAVDFGFSDIDNNNFQSIIIFTLPINGILAFAGVPVLAGQTIAAASLGDLVFTPATGDNGSAYDAFTFFVQDDGGTSAGGVDTNIAPNRISINVSSVNDAPSGSDKTITTSEDTPYYLSVFDFGFSDSDNNNLQAVTILTTPAKGQLLLSSMLVTAGQVVSASQISNMQFVPEPNVNQLGYDNFRFAVTDDGGAVNGGADTDPMPNVISVDVLSVNDAPAAAGTTVTTLEDTPYQFNPVDFGFSDIDGDSFKDVVVQTMPSNGLLLLSGVPVTMGQTINVAMIPSLRFVPTANANGAGFDSFQYIVSDDGGIANGGADTSAIAGEISIDVLSVNDAPNSVASVVTALEDTAYVFNAADFLFTDIEGHGLQSVIVTSLPESGQLYVDGVPVTVAQVIEASRVPNLVYLSELNSNTDVSFTYQIQDNGGIANGGQDSKTTDSVMTIQLTPINDAPLGIDTVVTTPEDTPYQFTSSDFNYSDVETDSLKAMVVSDLPVKGALVLAGVPVAANQNIEIGNVELLEYVPDPNAHGIAYDSLTVLVVDSGGVANGGADTASVPLQVQIDVVSVNDAPAGGDIVIGMLEDSTYKLLPNDFSFSDATDSNAFHSVRIDSLPARGQLSLSGVEVVTGQLIGYASLLAGDLEFTPDSNTNGLPYGDFRFQVIDDGGTNYGGLDTDPVANNVNFNVLPANDPPESADVTIEVVEDTGFIFSPAQFAFSDVQDLDAFDSIVIESLPSSGKLLISGDNVIVGQAVSATDLLLGDLIYYPQADVNGAGLTSFTFRVLDDGARIDNSNRSISPYTVFVDVLAVNDAPQGSGSTTNIVEGGVHVFQSGEFGFADASDMDQFTGLLVTQIPANGELSFDSAPVVKDQFVSLAEIDAGLMSFTALDDIATGIEFEVAEFGFKVVDNGGTLRAGINTDLEERFIEFNIAAVNDAPQLLLTDVVFDEGSQNLLDATMVSTVDVDDSADELVLTVVSTPGHGELLLNGEPLQSGAALSVSQLLSNELYYAHNGSEASTDTFQLSLKDGGEDGVQPVIGQFNIAVNEVIDPLPELTDDNFVIPAAQLGSTNGIGELASSSVIDNDTLFSTDEHVITLETEPKHGIVIFNDDGTFNYIHNGGVVLQDSFTYRVTNSDNLYQVATVSVTVEPPISAAFSAPIATAVEAAVGVELIVAEEEELVVEQSKEPEPEAEFEAELTEEEVDLSLRDNRFEVDRSEREDSIVLFQNETQTFFSTQILLQDLESIGIKQHNRNDSIALFEESNSTANSVNLLVDLEVKILDLRGVTDNSYFKNALERIDEDLNFEGSDRSKQYELGSETVFSVSLSATAGVLVWALRGGAFFASMMAATPLWSSIDPMQVMGGKSRDDEKEPADSVERVFDD